MAKKFNEMTVTVPVLDRLIDLEPGNQTENPLSRSQSERMLRRAVRRDLEWLLNTRRIWDAPDDSMKLLQKSVYMYGLPDLSTLTMATAGDRKKLERQIVDTINAFEPRLKDVRLVLVEMPDAAKSEVRLRIDAILLMDPAPEPITFDTVLELKSGSCRLAGGEDAR